MLTDAERRMLQEQGLGECWHEVSDYCCSCGDCFNETAHVDYLGRTIDTHLSQNRTFRDAQDYEDLLIAVVMLNVEVFADWIFIKWDAATSGQDWPFSWFLTLSIEERCKLICDFGTEVLGWK